MTVQKLITLVWADPDVTTSSGFRSPHFQVVPVRTLNEAVRRVQESAAALVVSELQLDGQHTGMEFVQQLRMLKVTTPVVFVAKNPRAFSESQILVSTPAGVFAKPLNTRSFELTLLRLANQEAQQ